MPVCVAETYSSQIIYQEEDTFKADPAVPAAKILYLKSESLQINQPLFASEAIRADRNSLNPSRGNFDIAGSIETELSPYMGSLLKFAIGSAVSAPSGAAFLHTIKIGRRPPSFLIEKGFTDVAAFGEDAYFKFNGCRINSWGLTFSNEGILQTSFDIMGCKVENNLTSYDAAPTNLGHDPWDMFEAAITEGGAPIAVIQEAAFTVENNLDGTYYVIGGQGERECLPAGYARVSGTITALYRDNTLYNKAKNFTESSMVFTFSRGLGDGTAGNEKMILTIPELKYGQQGPAIEGPGGVKVTFPFEAYYDNAAEATSLQLELYNTQASI